MNASSSKLLKAIVLFASIHGLFCQTSAVISNVFELVDAINAIPGTDPVYMGFLSQGNYDSVAHMFPARMQPKIFETVPQMEECVLGTEECIAGLSVNRPLNDQLTIFGVGSVKLRGFMFKRLQVAGSSPVQHAINGAINKLADSKQLQVLKQSYYDDFGVDTVEVRTCAGDASIFEHDNFDDIRNAVITIGGLGPYNWDSLGDYTVTPNTGFWPDYLALLEDELKTLLNVSLVYKWWPSSQQVMQAVEDGEVDCTDVYWTMPANYDNNGTSVTRLSAFDWSCAVLGTDDLVFTKTPIQPAATAADVDSGDSSTLAWQTILWITILCSVVLLITLGSLAYVIKRERDGVPLFMQVLLDELEHDEPDRGNQEVVCDQA